MRCCSSRSPPCRHNVLAIGQCGIRAKARGSRAMPPRTKSALLVVGVLGVLVAATVGVAMLLVRGGIGPTAASFLAAACVAFSLGLYGSCYQRWARAFWGAPFHVGDRVRVVRGRGAGSTATVVEVGQGVEVEIKFDNADTEPRRRLCWGGLRRVPTNDT